MAGTGFLAGSAMNASSHIKEVGNFFRRSKPGSEPAEEPNVPTDQPSPTPDQLPPTSSEPHIPKRKPMEKNRETSQYVMVHATTTPVSN